MDTDEKGVQLEQEEEGHKLLGYEQVAVLAECVVQVHDVLGASDALVSVVAQHAVLLVNVALALAVLQCVAQSLIALVDAIIHVVRDRVVLGRALEPVVQVSVVRVHAAQVGVAWVPVLEQVFGGNLG